ncbi:MAG: carboxypeptidase regulatory-like domain-containing protein [Candidatus Hydrogenedentes bacterium]|nr:carboxypeptidase regulatory-like domain-containing protein [Candidatus Hydrogenedentota bacterium]
MRYLALIFAMAAAGCGPASPPPPSAPAPVAPAAQQTPVAPAPAHAAETASIAILVVDLDGQPLANMLPIATTQPNAFDSPVAKGALTDAEGKSSLSLASGQYVYVRAWDPTRRMFANNYFDVMAGDAKASTDPLTVVMAHGAELRVALVGPNQKPAANTEVELMMSHPQKGPWWPDQTKTDAEGAAIFPCVPPGKYVIKLKAASGGQLELAGVALPPAGKTDLGSVTLQ